MGGWIGRQEEYEVSGPAIERYLKDEDAVSDPMELETGILFPVSSKYTGIEKRTACFACPARQTAVAQ